MASALLGPTPISTRSRVGASAVLMFTFSAANAEVASRAERARLLRTRAEVLRKRIFMVALLDGLAGIRRGGRRFGRHSLRIRRERPYRRLLHERLGIRRGALSVFSYPLR